MQDVKLNDEEEKDKFVNRFAKGKLFYEWFS